MSRYHKIIEKVFLDRYQGKDTEVAFSRDNLVEAANTLNLKQPKNLGDIVYALRYRSNLPDSITETAPDGKEWVIRGSGTAEYTFRLVTINRIVPNASLVTIKIPDATPEIVFTYALSDEQALLAKVRYNRLIDVFLGVAAYSLQNHLRTRVTGIGQIEIDEIYVAVDSAGRQFVLPVQAKGGKDQLSVIQSEQDILCCGEKYPSLICRAISTQFMENDLIALFEVALADDQVKLVQEKHYRLVPASEISDDDLALYRNTAQQ